MSEEDNTEHPEGLTDEPLPRRGILGPLGTGGGARLPTRAHALQGRAGRYLERRGGELDFTGQAEWGSEGTFANGANGTHSVVAGGVFNIAFGEKTAIGGGQLNNANSAFATIGGGSANLSSEKGATVGGGSDNSAEGVTSVISGGEGNTATGDNATIGGGKDNYSTAPLATIGGGGPWSPGTEFTGNRAKGKGSTVSGGLSNEALGHYSTIGGGAFNAAIEADVGGIGERVAEWATVGGGADNRAKGNYATVGGGNNNEAIAEFSTVAAGKDNEARGRFATVPGGRDNVAEGKSSFAAGEGAKATFYNSFVWNDGNVDSDGLESFESTDVGQFLVRAGGGVGIGTNGPESPFHLKDLPFLRRADEDDPEIYTSLDTHLASLEIEPQDEREDVGLHRGGVLALKSGKDKFAIDGVHFITFFDKDEEMVGRIEGEGQDGITLVSGGADYAERLPLRNDGESFEPGEVVGVHAGEISRETAGADRAMVVSATPVVVGNASPRDDDESAEAVAVVGQVETKVEGAVETGDMIVPSEGNDGTGVAVDPADWCPGEHGPLVGRAWETDSSDGVTEVTVAVGLDETEEVATRLDRQRETIDKQAETIDELRKENATLRERIESLESRIGTRETTIETHEETIQNLEGELEDLQSRVVSISKRLTGVESAQRAGDQSTAD